MKSLFKGWLLLLLALVPAVLAWAEAEELYTITLAPAADVEVLSPAGLDLGKKVARGNYITIRAKEKEGMVFSGWEVSPADVTLSSTGQQTSFWVEQDITIVPKYVNKTYFLELSTDPSGLDESTGQEMTIGGTAMVNGLSSGYFNPNDNLILVATPSAGFKFKNWSLGSGSATFAAATSATTQITLGEGNNDNKWRITAHFVVADEAAPGLLVKAGAGGAVRVKKPNGTLETVPDGTAMQFAAALDDVFELTALTTNPQTHFFLGWNGPVNVGKVTVVRSMEVEARFQVREFDFAVKTRLQGEGALGASRLSGTDGTTTVLSSGVAEQIFPADASIALTAAPAEGYAFLKWEADNATVSDSSSQGYNPGEVTALARVGGGGGSVTAVFVKAPELFALRVTAPPGGQVRVGVEYYDITIGAVRKIDRAVRGETYAVSLPRGTVAKLAAGPDDTDFLEFERWSADPAGSVVPVGNPLAGNAEVTMNGPREVTADFKKIKGVLTVSVAPQAAGAAGVDVRAGGVSVVGDRTHDIPATLALTPVGTADGIWVFDRWEGAVSGTVPGAVTVTGDMGVTAHFTKKQRLVVQASPPGYALGISGTGLTRQGDTYTGLYDLNAEVAISVSPATQYVLRQWAGDTGTADIAALRQRTLLVRMSDLGRDRMITAQLIAGVRVDVLAVGAQGSFGSLNPVSADNRAIGVSATGGRQFWMDGTAVSTLRPNASPPDYSAGWLEIVDGSGIATLGAPDFLATDGGVWKFKRWVRGASDAAGETVSTSSSGGAAVSGPTTFSAVYSDSRELTLDVYVDGVKNPAGAPAAQVGGVTMAGGGTRAWRAGSALTLRATAPDLLTFSHWAGPGVTSAASPESSLTIDRSTDAQRLEVYFKTKRTVTIDIVTEGGEPTTTARAVLIGKIQAGGVPLAFAPENRTVNHGDSLQLRSTSGTGTDISTDGQMWRFKGWITNGGGAVDSTGAAYNTGAVQADRTIKAVFVRYYQLTVNVSPAASPAAGRATPASGAWYQAGGAVNLTATAVSGSGYVFEQWTSDTGAVFASGANSAANSLTMDRDHTVTARFGLGNASLTVQAFVNNWQWVASGVDFQLSAGGVSQTVPTGATREFPSLTTVEVQAVASNPGWVFDRWTGPALETASTANPARLNLLGGQTLQAHFISTHQVTLDAAVVQGGGTGGTATAGNPRGTSGNVHTYHYGDQPQFTARPAAGYAFLGWQIDTNGDWGTIEETQPSATFTRWIGADFRLRPVFARQYTLQFLTAPSATAGAVNQPSTYVAYHGEVIANITAVANQASGWAFSRWAADPGAADAQGNPLNGSAAGSVSLRVADSHVLTANFVRTAAAQIALTVTTVVDDGATPVPAGLTVLAGGSTVPGHENATALAQGQSKVYYIGDDVALTATVPAALSATYEFVGWGDTGATTPVRTISALPASRTVAAFYRTKATLRMAINPAGIGSTTPAAGGHTTVPPEGRLYLNRQVGIDTALSAGNIDTYAFTGWTVDGGAAPVDPQAAATTVNLDRAEKWVTANYAAGHRVEARVRYETTATPQSAQSFATVSGSRTGVAAGGGNIAGIENPYSGATDAAIRTIQTGAQVTLVAAPARHEVDPNNSMDPNRYNPDYVFLGWDLNGDGVVDDTAPALTRTVAAPITATAIFAKKRVVLILHTHPGDTVGVTASAGGGKLTDSGEPQRYEVFHRQKVSLSASAGTAGYAFDGWYYGEGRIGAAISKSRTTESGPLADEENVITAVFLPQGEARLYIFINPDDLDNPAEHALVSALSAANYPYTRTRVAVGGQSKPVCIVSTRKGALVELVASGGSGGYGFVEWRPFSGYQTPGDGAAFGDRFARGTTYQYPTNQTEVSILAIYRKSTTGASYQLSLVGHFVDAGVGFLLGAVNGSTIDPVTAIPYLYVTGDQMARTYDRFPNNHVEIFSADSILRDGPFAIERWEYRQHDGALKADLSANVSDGGLQFTNDPGVAGESETVHVYFKLKRHLISLNAPVVRQPAGWPVPSGLAGEYNFAALSETRNSPRDEYPRDEVAPPASPHIRQTAVVPGSSAPWLRATIDGAVATTSSTVTQTHEFRFIGWDLKPGNNGEDPTDSTRNSFSWTSNWPSTSIWPKQVNEARTITPVFVRRMPLTLELANATEGDNATSTSISVNVATPSATRWYDYNRSLSVSGRPDGTAFNMVDKWVVETDTDGDGIFETREEFPNTATGNRSRTVILSAPTKVTVHFIKRPYDLTAAVANSSTGGRHGKVMIDAEPDGGAPVSIKKTYRYGDTPAIAAIPDAGYAFAGWTVSADAPPADASAASTTVYVDRAKTVTARFERTVTLETRINPDTFPGNLVTPEVGVYTELEGRPLTNGAAVTLQAGTDGDYEFLNWVIVDQDGARTRNDTAATQTLGLSGGTVATAHYARLHRLELRVSPAPAGEESAATASPKSGFAGNALNVRADGDATLANAYRAGTVLALQASPGRHFTFKHWEISLGGEPPGIVTANPAEVVMNGDATARAVFEPRQYVITLTHTGDTLLPIATGLAGTSGADAHDFLTEGTTWVLPYKSVVTLTAAPAERYRFQAWQEDGATRGEPLDPGSPNGPGRPQLSFELTENRTLVAQFQRNEYALNYTVDPVGGGGVTGGDGTALPAVSLHAAGSTASIKAVENLTPGYGTLFSHWSGDIAGPGAEAGQALLMNRDRHVTAHFQQALGLRLELNDSAGGTVALDSGTPPRRMAGDDYVFAPGDVVGLRATVASGHYDFQNWVFAPAPPAGANAAAPVTAFTLTGDLTATAYFQPKRYTLSASVTVNGAPVPSGGAVAGKLVFVEGGAVTHDFLTQGGTVIRTYSGDTAVLETVPVEPVSGQRYRFDRWVEKPGNNTFVENSLSMTLERNAAYEADFIRQARITVNDGVDITLGEDAAGRVPLSGVVSQKGTRDYDVTATPRILTVVATAPEGHTFARWEGATGTAVAEVSADKSQASLVFTIDAALADAGDIAVTPLFVRKKYVVNVRSYETSYQVVGVGGMVSVSPAPLSVGVAQGGTYYYGETLALRLFSTASGYRFVGWDLEGNRTLDGTDPVDETISLRVTRNQDINALFVRQCTLTLESIGDGTVRILSPGTGIPAGGGNMWSFDANTEVTLLASAVAPAEFQGWAGGVDSPNTARTTIVMDEDQYAAATFGVPVRHTLTLLVDDANHGRVTVRTGEHNGESVGGPGGLVSRTFEFKEGAEVDLAATPLFGFGFAGWMGPVLINDPDVPTTRLIMDGNKTVTGTFGIARHTLTVSALPSNGGLISISGGEYTTSDGIRVSHAAQVLLAARAMPGCAFLGWDVNGNGVIDADEPRTVTWQPVVTASTSIRALFRVPAPENAGNLSVIIYPSSAAATYLTYFSQEPGEENVAIVEVFPAEGHAITGWGGPDYGSLFIEDDILSGNGRRARIRMNRDKTIHVSLSENLYQLDCLAAPSDKGAVSGSGLYAKGTKVEVSASSLDPSWVFSSWAGVNAPGSIAVVTVDSDPTVVRGYFSKKLQDVIVNVGFVSPHRGLPADQVSLAGASAAQGALIPAVTKTFKERQKVSLGATLADTGNYRFVRWNGVADQLLQDGVFAANTVLNVEGTGRLDLRALVLPINPILITRAACNEVDESIPEQERSILTCLGGSVTEVGITGLDETVVVWANPEPGWRVDKWLPVQVLSGTGESSLIGDPLAHTDPECPFPGNSGSQGHRVRIGAEVSELVVFFSRIDDGGTNNTRITSADGERNQLQDGRTRDTGHYYDYQGKAPAAE